MKGDKKEVYYNKHCKTCKHLAKEEWEEPCNQCLTQGWNIDSHKPTKWEARK